MVQFERGTRILRVIHGRDARAALSNCITSAAFDPERKSDNLSLDLPRVIIVKFQRYFVTALFLALLAFTRSAAAQSIDQSLPTPVLTNEINGRIAALDLEIVSARGASLVTHITYRVAR